MRKRDELVSGCMAKARDNEMTFVLLGRDEDAPGTIRDWIARRIASGKNRPGDAKLVEAEECARIMEIERDREAAPVTNQSYDGPGLDESEPPASLPHHEIAALADRLALERARIKAPAPDDDPPWGELCAWASRGSDYMAEIRANPPEDIYRELLAEVARLGERLAAAEAERDAWVAAVDKHVAGHVAEKFASDPAWVTLWPYTEAYSTRAEAEAAYRRLTGLDVPKDEPANANGG